VFPFLRRVGKTYQGFVKAMAMSGAFLLDRLARRQVRQAMAGRAVGDLTGRLAQARKDT